MKTARKKILSLALAMLLVMGVVPVKASIFLGLQDGMGTVNVPNTDSNASTVVGFGGHEWLTIGYNGTGVQSGEGTLTLLAKNADFGQMTAPDSYAFAYELFREKMDPVYEAFAAKEKALVRPVTLDSVIEGTVEDQHVWPLSRAEAAQFSQQLRIFDGGKDWWVRAVQGFNQAITAAGHYGSGGFGSYYVRPAFKLDISSVLFTSAAAVGKPEGRWSPIEQLPGAVKLTVKDSDLAPSFNIHSVSKNGNGFDITYSGAEYVSGENRALSAIVKNSSGAVTYYNKLEVINTNSNVSSITISAMPNGFDSTSDTLYLFVEQQNGQNFTDFASEPQRVVIPSSDSGLTRVAGQNITASGEGTAAGNAKTASIAVANSVSSISASDITPAEGASVKLYSDNSFTTEGNVNLNVSNNNHLYIKVTAEDGLAVLYYDVTVTRAAPPVDNSSGGNDSNSSNSSSSSTPIVTIPPIEKPAQPDQPTIGSVTAKVQGTTFTITDSLVKAALEQAQAASKAQNRTANGVGVQLVLEDAPAAGLTLTLERAALERLVNADAKRFELTGTPISLAFNAQGLSELLKQGSGNVAIAVKPAAVQNVRNAFDISLSTVKDGKTVNITSLGTSAATLSIPTKPGKDETAGSLYAVYVDANGKQSRIADSFYDTNSGSVLFRTNHFSVYGVGYAASPAQFTDISNHWAKESIDYVVGRGLLAGTSDTAFSPNTSITRGEFVAALGRLAGVDVKAYPANRFTDVKGAFRPYIEWAYSKGIMQGIGNGKFAPEKTITRQEMALLLQNYAKATGYTLPVTREATAFADASSIGSAYKTAVTAVQQAGIMMGKQNNRFNPAVNATRAEASAMLHRTIKLIIDPTTAQGWVPNDDGQFLYYKDGKAVTGTQTIDGVKYFFNDNGTLKTGWMQDGRNRHFYSGNILLVGFWDIGANGNNKRYYFDTYGNMVAGKWLQIDGKWYYFNADGSLARSTKIDGHEVNENGVRKIN